MAQLLLTTLRERLGLAGFDLVQPFQVGWYNRVVAEEYHLPDYGRPAAFGVIIGANKNLWKAFLKSLKRGEVREHPLDHYTEQCISESLIRETLREVVGSRGSSGGLPAFEIRYSHHWGPTLKKVAIQRLAHVSNLAFLNQTCHLSVHPVYGAYISLKAASTGQSFPAPSPSSC